MPPKAALASTIRGNEDRLDLPQCPLLHPFLRVQVKVKRRGDDTKFVATVLAIGTECDIALLTVEDEAFWKDVEPLNFGTLPRLQVSRFTGSLYVLLVFVRVSFCCVPFILWADRDLALLTMEGEAFEDVDRL
jgi:hypothetical protein